MKCFNLNQHFINAEFTSGQMRLNASKGISHRIKEEYMLCLINVHEALSSWIHLSDAMNSIHKYEMNSRIVDYVTTDGQLINIVHEQHEQWE